MPAVRQLTHRRRSSLSIGLTQVKPGNYGINTPSPRTVTFAPNVTPGTYIEEGESSDDESDPTSPSTALFPPSETPAPAPSRRRVPPGKRRSQGYIPRPPNAFMLFRADFVRQKHVPGSIETNHGSLSKIIGNCWRALPLEEKKIWESRAKKAKAEHRERYPNYRFRPVHNKHKKQQATAEAAKRKDKLPIPAPDERRCEEVAQLLLEGKKGDELAAAVRRLDLDRAREMTTSASPLHTGLMPLPMVVPTPLYAHRRSSSVPPPTTLYNGIALPSVPFFHPQQTSLSRPESPIGSIARSNRMFLGQRRASSACAMFPPSWGVGPAGDMFGELQRDDEPLPDVDTSLFQQSYLDPSSFAFGGAQSSTGLFVETFSHSQPDMGISPFENVSPDHMPSGVVPAPFPYYGDASSTMGWMPALEPSTSGPSSAFSESPAPSEVALPSQSLNLHAPQPQLPAANLEGWNPSPQPAGLGLDQMSQHHNGLGVEMGGMQPQLEMDFMESEMHLQDYANGLEHAGIYAPQELVGNCGATAAAMDGYLYHEHSLMGQQEVVQY